jgi:predicted oxidoreductase
LTNNQHKNIIIKRETNLGGQNQNPDKRKKERTKRRPDQTHTNERKFMKAVK